MLTCFNLSDGVSLEEFDTSLRRFSNDLIDQDLLASTGPVGRRHRHPVMDTDTERNHEYFFVMCFDDLAQCDEAVKQFQSGRPDMEPDHIALQTMVHDPVFICWEDILQEHQAKTCHNRQPARNRSR